MTNDLSRYHSPVAGLFRAHASPEEWEACRLSDPQVAFYEANVFRDGVRSNSDAPPLEGVPVIPKGEPMGGRFFPPLFERP